MQVSPSFSTLSSIRFPSFAEKSPLALRKRYLKDREERCIFLCVCKLEHNSQDNALSQILRGLQITLKSLTRLSLCENTGIYTGKSSITNLCRDKSCNLVNKINLECISATHVHARSYSSPLNFLGPELKTELCFSEIWPRISDFGKGIFLKN